MGVNVAVGDGVNDGVNVNVLVGGTTELVKVGEATTGVLLAGTGVNVPVAVGGAPTTINALAVSKPLPPSEMVSTTVYVPGLV
jgi:hypothetical protein